MKNLFCYGFSMVSMLVGLAMLVGSHTAVSVASCDYCKVKVIAEVQSDALDTVAINETKKIALVVADNKIHVDKVKTDSAITASFEKSYDKVNAYAKKETICKVTDNVANAKFNDSVLQRFNQTAEHYGMAADSLVDVDIASLGSRQAGRYQQASLSKISDPASGATVKSGKQLHESGGSGLGATASA